MATCKAHDDLIVTVAEHGIKIESLEKDTGEQGRDIKGICKDVKAIRQQLDTDEVIEDMQPTSWINKSFKNFLEKGGWVLIGWLILKTFIFGEYPAFVQKERPYMKEITAYIKGEKVTVPVIPSYSQHDESSPHIHPEDTR